MRSSRQRKLLEELSKSWEAVRDAGIGSRIVLAEAPPGWGATTVLADFAERISDPEGPLAVLVSTADVPSADKAVEAKALSDVLLAPLAHSPLSKLSKPFGLDTTAGKTGLALGVSSLFVSGMPTLIPLVLAPYAVNAVQYAWDASPAGQQGVLARAARTMAAVSAEVPVVVVINDADRFDPDLVTVMIENLASRPAGRVLVVVAVHPGNPLASALQNPGRYGLAGRVVRAEADPDMSAAARTALAREIRVNLPDLAAERIGLRTASFADVFTVAAEGRLADLARPDGPAAVEVVDALIDATLSRPQPSAQAGVLTWADGALTIGQADQALAVLGKHADPAGDPDVIRAGGVARIRDPASARMAAQAARLSAGDRHALAATVLGEADRLNSDPDASLIDRTLARLAAHRVRADLDPSADLTRMQCLLIRGLEQLGDPEAAYQIAASAWAELPRDEQTTAQRADLLKAWLRLARTRPPRPDDPLIEEAVGLATSSGAVLDLEARVWAAVILLHRPGPHEAALFLVDQLIIDLGTHPGRDPAASQWRLGLAFHSGQAGYLTAVQQLLAPIINDGTPDQQKAARAVRRSLGDPRADTRLQIIILENELQAALNTSDEDRLRIHHALAEDYDQLGSYQHALQHSTEELRYRLNLQHPNHPDVLSTRGNIAYWTGQCGDARGALQLFQKLLPDQIRVLGRDYPGVLSTRNNIAHWTGQCGDARRALQVFQKLLPDMARVLGREHPDVLATRGNIARYTGRRGNTQMALRLSQELLPDMARVLGREHPDVLTIRNNIALWTGQCGDARRARRLLQELLPDMARVLGREHPDVLTIRNNIAAWTGQCGDARRARRLLQELLPDMTTVLGREHPDVLTIRNNIAHWTGQCGNASEALRLFQELLPDQIRVLGPDHPSVLATRKNIAHWTEGPSPSGSKMSGS